MAINTDFDPGVSPVDGFGEDGVSPSADLLNTAVPAEASEPVLVAQADVPAPAIITVAIETGGVVRLPEGASIDVPRVNGNDLEFVQPDGTVIVIPDGAVTGLTIFIGGVEIPASTVAELFSENGIQTAAGGPGGNGGTPGSGGNFTKPVPGIGDGLDYGKLLDDSTLGNPIASLGFTEDPDAEPSIDFLSELFVDEEGLVIPFMGNPGDSYASGDQPGSQFSATGNFVIDFDSDGPHASEAIRLAHPDATWTQLTNKTGILTADDGSWTAEVKVTTNANITVGTVTFTLLKPLAHGATDTEDDIVLNIQMVVKDSNGTEKSGTIPVTIDDDALTTGDSAAYTVDEDDIYTAHSHGTSPNDGNGDGSFTDDPANNNPGAAFVFGNLIDDDAVAFGADGPGAVAFQFESPIGGDLADQLALLGIASRGDLLSYEVENTTDGSGWITLTGHAGEGDGRTVFELKVRATDVDGDSDASTRVGDVEFRLYDQLDHNWGGGQNGDLAAFAGEEWIEVGRILKATDNDGDSKFLDDAFTIRITDDAPKLLWGAERQSVNEDDISTYFDGIPGASLGTSPNDGDFDGSYTGDSANGYPGPATVSGSLAYLVRVGADENPGTDLVFGFVEGEERDDALGALNALGLSSKGDEVTFTFGPSGNMVALADGRLVMRLVLESDGSYRFELYDQLDHDKPYDNFGDHPQLPGDTYFPPADQNQDLEDGLPGFGEVTDIDFGKLIKATDYDGDHVVLNNKLLIKITDDIPEVRDVAPLEFTVDEDDIDTLGDGLLGGSLGNYPEDGKWPDGSYTGDSGDEDGGPATVSGSVAQLVRSGADEGLTFSFINENALRDKLEHLGLRSKGAELSYDVKENVLYAFDNAGPSQGESYDPQYGDRLVFKFTLDADGDFKFELFDQLDHDAPGYGADENTDLVDGLPYADVSSIDFGRLINATDYDGDSVNLDDLLFISIRDDVPELTGATEAKLVNEDDIRTGASTGTSPHDQYATDPDNDGDNSYTRNYAGTRDPAYVSGSLTPLVNGGADDTLKFSFIDEGALRETLEELGLSSKGELLSYDVQGNVLYAFRNDGGQQGVSFDPPADDLVFKLTVSPGGTYQFELFDQLDHDAPAFGKDENTDLQDDVDGDVDAIDFGRVIQATDFDGDSVRLAGAFKITVKDDVPQFTGKTLDLVADEDDIVTSQSQGNHPEDGDDDGSYTGTPNVGGGGPATIVGSLAGPDGVVVSGADDNLEFSFIVQGGLAADVVEGALGLVGLTSKGEWIKYEIDGNVLHAYVGSGDYDDADRLVFRFTLEADGDFKFELHDQLDHDPPTDDWSFFGIPADGVPSGTGSDENTDLQDWSIWDVTKLALGHLIKATDADGDSVLIGDKLTLTIRDDVPETTGATASIRVDEDELGQADGDNTNGVTDGDGHTDEATFSAAQLKALVNIGADDDFEFALKSSISGNVKTTSGTNVKSQGGQVKFDFHNGDIVGYVGSGGYTPGTDREVFRITDNGDGGFTFDLKDKIDHPANGDEGTLTIDLTPIFTAEDFDNDRVTFNANAITVVIENDVPVVATDTTNYIQNGNFADGSWSAPTWWGSQAGAGDVPGWSLTGTGTTNFERAPSGYIDLSPSTGPYMLDMGGSPGNLTVSQKIGAAAGAPDLTAGKEYVLELEAGAPFPGTALLEVLWNGVVVGTIDTTKFNGTMDKYAFTVEGTGNPDTDVITFREIGTVNANPVPGTWQGHALATEGHHGTYIANVRMFALDAVVDEDGLATPGDYAQGNHDTQTGDAEDENADGDNDATTARGLLGIQWGADSQDTADAGGVQDGVGGPPGLTGRSLTFTDNLVDVLGVNALTSHGDAVTIVLSSDNTVLRGIANDGSGNRTVFEVRLSDDNAGSFTFQLFDRLDHAPGADENDIALRFNYTATDSDGDTATGSFAVGIDDDTPVAVNEDPVTVDEDSTEYSGNVLANDHPGADGAALTKVSFDGTNFEVITGGDETAPGSSVYEFARAEGTYTFAANGDWSFAPTPDYNGPAGFSYIITDGDGDESDPPIAFPMVDITINAVNDDPTITVVDSAAHYVENAPYVLVFDNAEVEDIDTAVFTGGSLTATVLGGLNSDDLNLLATGATPFLIAGGQLFLRVPGPDPDVLLGDIAGRNTPTLSITNLTSAATHEVMEQLIEHLQFRAAGNDPTDATRTVEVTLADGQGGSGVVTGDVTVEAVNDAPNVSPDAPPVASYTEQGAAIQIWPNATVSDPDAENYAGGSVRVSIADPVAGDALTLALPGAYHIESGTELYRGASLMGTVDGVGTDEVTLTNLTTAATDARVREFMRAVRFESDSDDPGTSREVTFTVNDGGNEGTGGPLEDAVTVNIAIIPVNDAPVIGGTTGGEVNETGDIAGIDEAGWTGAFEPRIAFNGTITTALTGLLTTPGSIPAALATIAGEFGGNSHQAIAVIWDYLDDIYTSAGPNQGNVNEAFVRLGIEYAELVKNGGSPPFTDIAAKYDADTNNNGIPQRLQSLHDNLLGNLQNSALDQRFGAAMVGLRAQLADLIDDVDPDLLTRVYYDGGETHGAQEALARQWDIDNGFAPQTSGQLTVNDPDQIGGHTWAPGSYDGTYGTFTLDQTGKWTYVLDNTRPATQALAQGEVVQDSFTAVVTDNENATGTQLVTVDIHGTNDAPVITGNTPTAFAGGVLASVVDADTAPGFDFEPVVDHDDTIDAALANLPDMAAVLAAVNTSDGGTLADAIAWVWDYLDYDYVTNGPYQIGLNEAFSRLGIEYAKYLATGGVPLYGMVAKYTADGIDGGSDPDRLQTLHDNLLGNLGGPALAQRFTGPGNPIYDAIVDALEDAGLLALLQRPYYSGNEGSANNALAWDQLHGLLPAQSGQLSAADVDAGAVLTWSGSAAGSYGSFAVGADGAWTYTLDPDLPALKGLAAGETATEQFTVTVTDQFGAVDTHVVTVTATGINDAPTDIELSGTGIPAGAATGFVVGTVTVTDPDSDSFTITTDQPNLAVQYNSGTGTYELVTTGPVTSLPASVVLTANDGEGGTYSEPFVLTLPVQVFDTNGALVGSYSTIQAAVNSADPGYRVEASAGTYNENVTIGEGITLVGIGAVVIDGGTTGPAVTVTGGGAGQSLVIDNIDLTGDAASVLSILPAADFDNITFENGDVTGGDYYGLFLNNAVNVDALTIENAVFSSNGTTESGGSGEGPITIFLYNGDVTLKNVDVVNPGAAAENGIQIRGIDALSSMGNVTFDGVDVSGTYLKTGVAIYNYTNVAGLVIVGGGLDIDVDAGWHGLNIDNVGGSLDLSGVPLTVANSHAGASNDIAMQGNGSGQTFTADVSDDLLLGSAGADTLKGGGGNDAFVLGADVVFNGSRNIQLGDGSNRSIAMTDMAGTADVVQGGTGDDTIVLGRDGHSGYIHDTYSAPAYVSGVEAILGTDGGDFIAVSASYTSDAPGGGITIEGGAGDDVLGGGAAADTIRGGDDDDLISGLGGVDQLEGGAGNDEIWGGAGDDILVGGGALDSASDVLLGNAGNDTLYGNETDLTVAANKFAQAGESDIAAYSGSASDYAVTWNDGLQAFQVTRATAGGEGIGSTDTLYGIEGIDFGNDGTVDLDLSGPVMLFNNAGKLVDTFDTIQGAVDAAGSVSGYVTIRVGAGTYNENVVIDRGNLTLESIGGRGSTTINGQTGGPENATITVQGGLDNVRIGGTEKGFTIVGFDKGNPGIENAAVYVLYSDATNPTDNFELRGNDVVANGEAGLLSDWNAAITDAVIADNIFSGKTFVGPEPGGPGDQFSVPNMPRQLVAFGQGSDPATNQASNIQFIINQITGTAGGVNANGEQGNTLVTIDASHSVIASNLFTGFTNGTGYALRVRGEGTSVQSNAVNHLPNSSESQGFFVDNHGVPGTYSGNNITGASAGEILFGTPGNDAIHGNDGADTIYGGAGNDTINGNAGDDTIVYVKGDGADTVNAGIGDLDTQVVIGTGAAETFAITAAGASIDIDVDGAQALTLSGIDDIVVQTGGGGDTVTIAGDFGLTDLNISTITVEGGDGADIVDASGLTSAHGIDFRGGGGNDEFTAGPGNDTFIGGSGSDTLVLSGDMNDYVISYDPARKLAVITDTNGQTNGEDGTVAFAGIETIAYANDTLNLNPVMLFDDNNAFVGSYTTIQSAIGVAGPNHTILISEGTYTEQIFIGSGKDGLTIVGNGDVTIQAPDDLTQTDTSSSGRAVNAIISVNGVSDVSLINLDVDGLGKGNTVDGANANFVGVSYRNASGGLTDVDITGIHDAYPGGTTAGGHPIQSGNQRGVGLTVDNDTLLDFSMQGGSITDFQKNATSFVRANLDIDGVTVDGGGAQTIIAQNGFQAVSSTGQIVNSQITGIGYAGSSDVYSAAILLFDNFGLFVVNNSVVGANDESPTAKVVGVYAIGSESGAFGQSGIGNNTISHTDIGIIVTGDLAEKIVVAGNVVTDLDGTDNDPTGVEYYPDPTSQVTDFIPVIGSDADDYLMGAAGNDQFMGLGGNDTLIGNGGSDTLEGNDGIDFLSGGDGDDVLIGGLGFDTLTGDGGADTFVIDSLDVADLITDYSGVGGDGDKVDLTALFDATPGNVGDFVNYDETTGKISVNQDGVGTDFVEVATVSPGTLATSLTIIFDDGTNTHETTANTI